MNSKTTSQACSYDPFCLGMCEWIDCPGAGLGGANTDAELPHPLQIASLKVVSPIPFVEQPSTSASSSAPPSKRTLFNLQMKSTYLSKLKAILQPILLDLPNGHLMYSSYRAKQETSINLKLLSHMTSSQGVTLQC